MCRRDSRHIFLVVQHVLLGLFPITDSINEKLPCAPSTGIGRPRSKETADSPIHV
jgi:hypothetical protein